MSRIKGGVQANKRRRNMLARAKGYRYGSSKKIASAHESLMRAGRYAYFDVRLDAPQAPLADLPARACYTLIAARPGSI